MIPSCEVWMPCFPNHAMPSSSARNVSSAWFWSRSLKFGPLNFSTRPARDRVAPNARITIWV